MWSESRLRRDCATEDTQSASIPYFDQKKVVGLLDSLQTMDEGARVANDQVLMLLVSACVLHEGFHLAA